MGWSLTHSFQPDGTSMASARVRDRARLVPVRHRGGMTDLPDPHRRDGDQPVGPLQGAQHSLVQALSSVRDQLSHLESLIDPATAEPADQEQPTWQQPTAGEHRVPVAVAVVVAIGLQVALPAHLAFRPTWLLPVLEAAFLVGLVVANPRRINRSSTRLRTASLALIAVISLANAWSAGHLVNGLVRGKEGSDAASLLINGLEVYLTNIIVFALWYWDTDRGGPVARAQGQRPFPDFLFPQMTNRELAPADWGPTFVDYLYVSFTNATAFSPTDVMPLARWAKILMLIQSGVSLATVALVVARAVNILH
jgi:uncharacterized membrane protein